MGCIDDVLTIRAIVLILGFGPSENQKVVRTKVKNRFVKKKDNIQTFGVLANIEHKF